MEITPEDLKSKLDAGEKITIIDIREPEEHNICRLAPAKLIPMNQVPDVIGEWNPNDLVILYCHHGMRSWQVVSWMRKKGFENAWSLQGGIDAWAETIDPSIERY